MRMFWPFHLSLLRSQLFYRWQFPSLQTKGRQSAHRAAGQTLQRDGIQHPDQAKGSRVGSGTRQAGPLRSSRPPRTGAKPRAGDVPSTPSMLSECLNVHRQLAEHSDPGTPTGHDCLRSQRCSDTDAANSSACGAARSTRTGIRESGFLKVHLGMTPEEKVPTTTIPTCEFSCASCS